MQLVTNWNLSNLFFFCICCMYLLFVMMISLKFYPVLEIYVLHLLLVAILKH